MKNISELQRKILVRVFSFIVVIVSISGNFIEINSKKYSDNIKAIEMQDINEYNLEEDVVSFINENNLIFNFYADMFGISISNLKESIINNNTNKLNRNDIGNSKKVYDNLEMNLIDFLFDLRKNNPKIFKQEYKNANENSKEYIYGLINYFSNIYTNVDNDVLSSIAYIETGNLNSKYMLKCNNIYGGMGLKGLIKYNNIEFGVLSYVKMMSKNYYAKGLTTVDQIAKKYNPNSTTWVANVNKYKSRFNNDNKIDLESLINLKEKEITISI